MTGAGQWNLPPALDKEHLVGKRNIGSQQLQRFALQQILARYSKDSCAGVEHTDRISPRCRRPVLKDFWRAATRCLLASVAAFLNQPEKGTKRITLSFYRQRN
jgi:hypothetical protein